MKQFSLTAIVLMILSFMSISSIKAQVTIGSGEIPEKAALLDIKTQKVTNPISVNDISNITSTRGGLGLPRVHLVDKTTLEPFVQTNDNDWVNAANTKIKEKHAGLIVYNIKENSETETDINKIFRQGIYIWNGARWIPETKDEAQYFFVPSFNIPLTAIGTGLTFNLYGEYAKQFTLDENINSSFISSNPELKTIPSPIDGRLYKQSELDYVITYYDKNIIENISIDNNGVMTYDIKSLDTTPASFINLVFIVK